MELYIVMCDQNYDGISIVGVFDNLKDAEKVVDKCRRRDDEFSYFIEDIELNKEYGDTND